MVDPGNDDIRPLPDGGQVANPNGYGAGRTQLITQTSVGGHYEFSGNQDIDAVLIGSRWTPTTLTYSFPTSGTFYTDGTGQFFGDEAGGHVVFNAQQQTAARYAFNQVSAYTNLNFTEVTESASTHGNIRLSQTTDGSVGSAYGLFPSSRTNSGDIWFGRTNQPFYDTPAPGNWGQATIMHELGHTLGLKHGHQDYTSVDLSQGGYLDQPPGGGARYGSLALPSDHDGQDWSLMSYRSDPGAAGDPPPFQGDGFNQPQTYMQDDIAALQYLYGADFTTNSTNSVYTWNATTGEQSINGVGQGAPTGNVILRTVWDGNGIDTYNLSNYTTNLSVDLNPGAFSTFSQAQLANHRPLSGGPAPAAGNVANALLYNGDTRSLIENATGGTGADTMMGNQVANVLTGNNGNDTLVGSAGADQLYGGNNNDNLYGDARPGTPSGVGSGSGSFTKVPGNVSLATASDVTNLFSLASNANIIDSTTTPHVTISGTGDGNRDYYKVTVNAGTTLTFDIDNTSSAIDSFIKLYDGGGNVVAYDDDSSTAEGAGGSTRTLDSYLTYQVQTAGTYYIEVGDYLSSTTNEPIASGATYQLQVSAAGTVGSGSGTGNDILDGGGGTDNLYGGAGDDKYYVDNAGDTVNELANQGTDNVYARADYTLTSGSSIEYLRAFAGSTGLQLTGNDQNNSVVGGTGADTLDGGSAGTDKLYGGAGNDTYLVTRTSGVFIYENANEGTADTVQASVGVTLAANVENLTLTGGTAINGTGNVGANVLTGNGLTNTLQGMDGNDTLVGGGGADRLYGNAGSDTFKFTDISDSALSARDGIYDFVEGGTDKIDLSVIDAVQTSGSTGNQAFTFVSAFTGVAGQLRTFASSTTTYVEGDVNGDRTADFQIVLSGVHTLQGTDFVL